MERFQPGPWRGGPAHPRRTGPTRALTAGEQNRIGASPTGRGQNDVGAGWQWLGLSKQRGVPYPEAEGGTGSSGVPDGTARQVSGSDRHPAFGLL